MTKPTPRTRYDYHQCISYIEKKHGFDERDYYGHWKKREEHHRLAKEAVQDKFGNTSWWNTSTLTHNDEQKAQSEFFEAEKKRLEQVDPLPPRLDFWGDYLIDTYGISNGSTFTMSDYDSDGSYSKVPEFNNIVKWLLEEFGEDTYGIKSIDFEVSW